MIYRIRLKITSAVSKTLFAARGVFVPALRKLGPKKKLELEDRKAESNLFPH
jgi:hypothetical protein